MEAPIRFLYLMSVCSIIMLSQGLPDGMLKCSIGSYNTPRVYNSAAVFEHRFLPYKIKESDVKFFLYNRRYPYPFQLFLNAEDRLIIGNFDPKKPTKFIIHGYASNIDSPSSVLCKDAFLESGDFNIIVIDWSEAQLYSGGIHIPYTSVIKKLGKVAKHISNMISFLENYGMHLNTTTLVGHSLGAHIAGIASHNLKNTIYRIVGLDPAKPGFINKGPGERLSKEDAMHVEVIHTEIEECGLNNQLGHYDFYPNSGLRQPGCAKYRCSHSRSYRLFAESIITETGFYARKCRDWMAMTEGKCNGESAIMGGLERTTIPEGIYYVQTNDWPPYALGLQWMT